LNLAAESWIVRLQLKEICGDKNKSQKTVKAYTTAMLK